MHFIDVLQESLGKKAVLEMAPAQPGDVPDTEADVSELVEDCGYQPSTSVTEGVRKFADWYRWYFKV